MNTKQMDYLIETAKTLNLSRAAENLFISQPALSYQIKIIEEEMGFSVFERVGKSIRLTPAGSQFILSLERIRKELQDAIEQAQNLGNRYQDNISIGLFQRTALIYLPQAIQIFEENLPHIQVTPELLSITDSIAQLLKRELDVIILPKTEADKVSNIQQWPLYDSQIYLLCQQSDSLAKLDLVTEENLTGRTLLVNGGSSKTLRQVQQRVLSHVPIAHYNSPSHDYTLIQVASNKAICLSPGYLNDHSQTFAWVPFDCPEYFDMVLVTRKDETRTPITQLITILQELYSKSPLNL
ncbi:LysR family transcriptional regulator [Streptococcus sp. DD12]|uniref:LysR family transcriptional regulator n=1 Tax=Streptococcus sp. DD12 TaxID=1777880 RepID=UPI000794BB78|nr:LysR family transcriptional regulator [Streptococcus sp. DD12]KXT75517.1 Transcriptional regulator, LysR family [Streptococcus sp. DD12]